MKATRRKNTENIIAKKLSIYYVKNMFGLESCTVVGTAVVPRYPRYYRGSGDDKTNNTAVVAVVGINVTVVPRQWGQAHASTVVVGTKLTVVPR